MSVIPLAGGHRTPSIVVVGPGAMGCLFAAYFARAGHTVSLLGRDTAQAAALSRRGLRIDAPEGPFEVVVPVAASARSLTPADVLCLCVKSYDTAEAIRAALPLVRRTTVVASLQNGLSNAVTISSRTGPEKVVCAVTWQGATRLAPGHVRHAGFGRTLVGPFLPQQSARAERFAHLLEAAGFVADCTANTAGAVWSKLIVNAAINPVTALWNVTNGGLLENAEARETAAAAAREGERVARAKGITLLYDDMAAEASAQCERSRENLSSMLQDMRCGRRTEIADINGAIVREADLIDVDVPVNRMLTQRVTAIERGP